MKHDACSIPEYVDLFTKRLASLGCAFNDNGFPALESNWFMHGEPHDMVTFTMRNAPYIKDRGRTLLCFYSSDRRIYPRFDKIDQNLPIYREFMGVVAPDLTVTPDMDVEWQKEIILANQLFIALLGAQGVKIVQNLRIGSEKSLQCLSNTPQGIPCATGTLGCARTKSPADTRFTEKLLSVRPSIVYLYGKEDDVMRSQLELTGTPCKWFHDAHQRMKERHSEKQILIM